MTDAILSMLESGQKDINWFRENFEDFKLRYNDMFVAFSEEKVLECDKNLEVLLSKLKKKNIDTSKIFIEFISKVKSIL